MHRAAALLGTISLIASLGLGAAPALAEEPAADPAQLVAPLPVANPNQVVADRFVVHYPDGSLTSN